MASQPFKIAILGAGPAGLTLASLLSKYLSSIPSCTSNTSNTQPSSTKSSSTNPPFELTIFELRPPPSQLDLLKPTGSLDLHAESGQLALQKLGLLQQFLDTERVCSESLVICDKDGSVGHGDSGEGGRPECARGWLEGVLLRGVTGQADQADQKVVSLRRGRKVRCVERSGGRATDQSGKWLVTFSTCVSEKVDSEEFDLVVGADGAHSKTRKAVTEQEVVYSGVNGVTLTIPEIEKKYPVLAKRVGTGSYWALSKGKAVMCQRGSFGSARIYVMVYDEEEEWLTTSGFEALGRDAEGLKNKLLGEDSFFGGYGEEVKELIRVGCQEEGERMKEDGEEISIKRLWMLPVGHRWEHKKGVTMIGDAAHLMTPFAGEGVNLGMLDGLELGEAIIKGLEKREASEGDFMGEIDQGIRSFEEKMWARSEEVAGETWRNLEMFFKDEQAPKGWVDFFKSFDLPPVVGEVKQEAK